MNPPPEPPSHTSILRMLIDSGAVRFGSFTLASGQSSDVYVDIKKVWTDPRRLATIAEALAARLDPTDLLAGMELGAVPLVVAVALRTGYPYAIVRKAAKSHGTQNRIEGEIPTRARVVVLEDVVTTGGSVAQTIELLRSAGAEVSQVVSVVDREAGASALLGALRVRLESLATLSELRGSTR